MISSPKFRQFLKRTKNSSLSSKTASVRSLIDKSKNLNQTKSLPLKSVVKKTGIKEAQLTRGIVTRSSIVGQASTSWLQQHLIKGVPRKIM